MADTPIREMTNAEALIEAFVEEVIRRKKAELAFQRALVENARLTEEIADLKRPPGPVAVPKES